MFIYTTHSHTHTHCFNGHLPGEPGLAGSALIITGVEASFTGGIPFLPLSQPTAPKQWKINGHKLLQATGCPACHPTNQQCQHSEDM